MQTPAMTSSAETLLKVYGVYHLTRLQADRNLKALAEAFEKAQTRLKDKNDAFEAAQVAAMRAMAVRDGEDEALDEMVRKFYNLVLLKTGNNRKAPLFLRYFPDGVAPVVSAPLENELLKVEGILAKLAEEEDADLKAYTSMLLTTSGNLETAMDAHSAALNAEANAFAMLQSEKLNWFDTYKLNYREIARLYYKQPKKADTYFKPAPKPKKGKETPPAQAPA